MRKGWQEHHISPYQGYVGHRPIVPFWESNTLSFLPRVLAQGTRELIEL